MAEFQLDRLVDYSTPEILRELRRVAALVDHPVLTIRRFEAAARMSYQPVWARFGGWRAALEAAGLGHRCGARPVRPNQRLQPGRRMSDDQLLQALREIARASGRGDNTVTVQDVQRAGRFSWCTLRKRFGSWRRAVELAGLAISDRGVRYDDEACFANLLRVWRHHGRPPRMDEMAKPPSAISARPYVLRFGSWRRALAAFAARANAQESGQAAGPVAPDAARARRWARLVAPADRRAVPLTLRHAVLKRDRYRCVLCGDSPASDPACELHIDHVTAFALGGRTALDNLRTLCARCNLGRGKRAGPEETAARGGYVYEG